MSRINRWDVETMDERTSSEGRWVLHSDHEAEVARLRNLLDDKDEIVVRQDRLLIERQHAYDRLRAEVNAATKAGLDAIATICEKEREVDALRVDAMRYRWLRERANSDRTQICHYGTNWSWNLVTGEIADKTIDAAMGEGK